MSRGGLYDEELPKGTRNAKTGWEVGKSSAGSKKPPKTCVCMVMAFTGGVGWLVYDAAAAVLPYNPWDRW